MFIIAILKALAVMLAGLLGINPSPAPPVSEQSVPTPTITNLRYSTMAIDKGSTYDGIVVDVRVGGFTDATSCLVSIHRSDGTDATRACGPDSLAHINSTAGAVKSWTVPFSVLGSSDNSWFSSTTGTWTTATVPTGATVVITTTSHGDITATVSDALNTKNGEYAAIAPAPLPEPEPDTTPPTATLTVTGGKVVDGMRYVRPGDTIKYTVVAEDNDSGLDRASYQVFRLQANERTQAGSICGSWHNGKFPEGSNTRTGSFTMTNCNGGTAPADGPYGLAIRVYDNAGNNLRIPNSVFYVDGTKPVVSDLNAPELVSSSLNVTFKASDVTSGVEYARVYLADVQNGECKNNYSALAGYMFVLDHQASGEYATSIDTSALNGEYCMLVSARDNATNNSTPHVRKVTIDNAAPSDFAVISPNNGETVSGTVVVRVRVSDPSDITKLLLNVGGKAHSWTNGASSTITREGDIFSVTVDTKTLADGETFIVLRATDGAGNTRYWNNNARLRQHSFIIDNSGPVSDLNVDVQEDGTVIVSGSATDPSGFNRAYVQLVHRETNTRVGGTTINLLGQGTDVTWSRTYGSGELVDGTYAAHVALVDARGNVSNYGWTPNFVVQTAVATASVEEEPAPVIDETPAEETTES